MKKIILIIGIFFIVGILFLVIFFHVSSKIIIYPAPSQEPKSDDFEMLVNGKPVFVYQARVSKYPINQVWPGYQRPIEQTEIASFAYFDFNGTIEIKIKAKKEIQTLSIRPKEFGIKPKIKGNTITFKISKPLQFVVEINGIHNALHVFANPIEAFDINKNDPLVRYFGPGIHEEGIIKLLSNETVFIDGGAIVHGVIECKNAQNIKILGRGILDASKIGRFDANQMIHLDSVRNALISGIILRDPHVWTITPLRCDSITINNVKLIGLWRYNSDGIDVVNSKNVTIKNSFLRTFDDNIAIKGLKGVYDKQHNIIENITVDNCVLWNDWGRAIEIGVETVVDTMKNLRFSNCFIPHFTFIAMDIQNGDRGYIKDVYMDNISIEDPILDSLYMATTPINKNDCGKTIEMVIYKSYYTKDSVRGNIDNIHFNNIRYNSINNTYCNFLGDSDSNLVQNIFIKDYFINDKKVINQNSLRKNEFVKNIVLQ